MSDDDKPKAHFTCKCGWEHPLELHVVDGDDAFVDRIIPTTKKIILQLQCPHCGTWFEFELARIPMELFPSEQPPPKIS